MLKHIDYRVNGKHARGLSMPQGPHDMRFENFHTINTVCSKYIDPSQYPPFDKSLSRQQLEDKEIKLGITGSIGGPGIGKIYLQDYDPTFSQVMSKLSLNIPDFKK